jgi:hypothetical protein
MPFALACDIPWKGMETHPPNEFKTLFVTKKPTGFILMVICIGFYLLSKMLIRSDKYTTDVIYVILIFAIKTFFVEYDLDAHYRFLSRRFDGDLNHERRFAGLVRAMKWPSDKEEEEWSSECAELFGKDPHRSLCRTAAFRAVRIAFYRLWELRNYIATLKRDHPTSSLFLSSGELHLLDQKAYTLMTQTLEPLSNFMIYRLDIPLHDYPPTTSTGSQDGDLDLGDRCWMFVAERIRY